MVCYKAPKRCSISCQLSEDIVLNKIYKYTPLRLDFFDNLMIRASQKYALNDPFELRPSHKIKGSKTNKDDFKALAEQSYFDYAVVSLTETNNNLLMWSHYADQHKGIVIEFDTSEPLFDLYKSSPTTMLDEDLDEEVIDQDDAKIKSEINAGVIQRVRYNTSRPNMKEFDSILEHFLIKSEEWIYEKEHRVILPLVTADRIIVNEKYLPEIEHYAYSPDVLNKKFIANGMYMISLKEPLLEEARGLLPYDGEYVTREELQLAFVESIIHAYLQKISEDPTTIFLYQVPPKAVKSVYLGCKVTDDERNDVLNKISGNSNLSHVDIYQARTNSERFELYFEKHTSV